MVWSSVLDALLVEKLNARSVMTLTLEDSVHLIIFVLTKQFLTNQSEALVLKTVHLE